MKIHANGLLGTQMKKHFIFVADPRLKISPIVNYTYYMPINLKGKKEDAVEKDEIPEFIEKK